MSTHSSSSPLYSKRSSSAFRRWSQLALAGLALMIVSGCQSADTTSAANAAAAEAGAAVAAANANASASNAAPEMLTLKEGDTVKISFPGAPSLDTAQQIRQDGRIILPMIGEYVVIGKSTDALNKELLELYAPKLVSKEVNVTLMASPFTVYVTGAVLRPGKIGAERRISVFDAIMEAGGFDKVKANLREVVVVRQENGQSKSFKVNVESSLKGEGAPFLLKAFDTVYVPEKFVWF